MRKKDQSRPNCLYCGKPLARVIHSWNKFHGQTEAPVVGQEIPHYGKVLEIISDKLDYAGHREVRYWCGQYGRNRDDIFCGPVCAGSWGSVIAQGIKKFGDRPFEFKGLHFQVKTL